MCVMKRKREASSLRRWRHIKMKTSCARLYTLAHVKKWEQCSACILTLSIFAVETVPNIHNGAKNTTKMATQKSSPLLAHVFQDDQNPMCYLEFPEETSRHNRGEYGKLRATGYLHTRRNSTAFLNATIYNAVQQGIIMMVMNSIMLTWQTLWKLAIVTLATD